ncbi:MAG: SusC/RagA family TonB-linked outer membrane protein [Paraprevotella sp.]|nr:SusC/RagA family TonB-linked outer membrane protein [Paraprevotella sp.]
MKNILKYYVLIFCLAIASAVRAQGISSISGTVSDSYGPIVGASVVEIDESNRNISATVTDFNGNFTLKIKNPKDKLKISYVGLKAQILPINKRVFNVTMEDAMVLKQVEVKAKKRVQSSGLAIPEREVSFASQTINAKEFEGLGLTSVDEALQGRIAGLDIVMNSGNLGSGTTMRLRGVTSISTLTSSEPLIVVNGDVWSVDQSDFDVTNATDETFSQLLNVNPEDIESISVLKDAAATAIWGSQGANGVIEIKTKRGVRGKPKLTYSFRLTGTYQPSGIDLLTGDQYTMMMKEAYFNPTLSDAAADIPEFNYITDKRVFSEWQMFNNNTDWVKAVTQIGWRQNHFLSVTGGGDKATFRVSGGYDHETGSVIEQKLDRFTTRMMLDYYVSDRIKIISDFSLTYTDNQKNSDDLLAIAYKKMPNLSIFEEDENGNSLGRYYEMLYKVDALEDQRKLVNPVASAKYAKNSYKTYSIDPKLEFQYDILGVDDTRHRLTYNGKVTMNVYNAYEDKYYPRDLSTYNWNASGVSTASSYSSKSLAFTTTHTLTFTPHFLNSDHSFMAMGRFQLTSGTSSDQKTEVGGLPHGIEAPSAGNISPTMTSNFNRWRSIYYTFSAHYAFKERYIFDVSARVDGTTKFGPGKRWGVFPAVSGRWNIIDEPWMEPTRKWLSMLSIRPGWGMVGNQPSSDYLYVNQYASDATNLGSTEMSPSNMKINTLKWEMKYTWNLGFDLGFWNDRLTTDLNIYKQTTKDMLMADVRVPSISGFTTYPYRNAGDMDNTGWEFNIQTNKIVQTGKFSMDVNLTFANNRNVITRMDPLILESLNNDWEAKNATLLQRVQVDNPFGAIYGYRSKGVYMYNYDTYVNNEKLAAKGDATAQQWLQDFKDKGWTAPLVYNANGELIRDMKGDPLQMKFNYSADGSTSSYDFAGGDAIYEDVNHDGNINQLDIVYLGNSLPKLTGGFGFKFNYGNWSLNAQFNYRVNYDIVNLARLNMESMNTNNNQSQAVNYRWRKEGDFTSIPRALNSSLGVENYNTMISDRFVEDGTFLRLNYLQISYGLPQKAVKKIGLSGLRFYVSGNNLFCLTKYTGVDPELTYGTYSVTQDNAQTPRAKSYTLGITVDF